MEFASTLKWTYKENIVTRVALFAATCFFQWNSHEISLEMFQKAQENQIVALPGTLNPGWQWVGPSINNLGYDGYCFRDGHAAQPAVSCAVSRHSCQLLEAGRCAFDRSIQKISVILLFVLYSIDIVLNLQNASLALLLFNASSAPL